MESGFLFPVRYLLATASFIFIVRTISGALKSHLIPTTPEPRTSGWWQSPGSSQAFQLMYGPVGLPPCVRPGVSEFGLLFLTGYIRTGSIFLAQTQDRLISLKRINSRLKYV